MEVEAYRRRRPGETVLYRVVQENLATFLETASLRSGGKGLPAYVRQEFERYLDCGILANGFARVRYPGCRHDEVVVFSCKCRGFCPSCMGRRMADTAAYLLRPAFAEERLSMRADGRIEYGLRKPRWDGGTSVVLEPLELMEKLAALVPAPRSHLVRYHGVLGPSHEWREAVLPPAAPAEEPPDCNRRPEIEPWDEAEEEHPWREERRRKRRKATDWAELIRRSLKLDVLSCPQCGGRMRVISTITEPGLVRRMLRSLGLSTEIPPRAPPRSFPSGEIEFVQ